MSNNYLREINLLSIWEVAHRWVELHPDQTNLEDLPDALTERIREILSATGTYLNIYDETGKEELETLIPIINVSVPNKVLERANSYLLKRQYPKNDLDTFFIYRNEVTKWRLSNNLALPEFWYSESEIEYFEMERKQIFSPYSETKPSKSTKPITSQIIKGKCQDIAKQLWKDYPDINITAMGNHPKIIEVCTTKKKAFKEKTRREWVRKIAPTNIKGKSGRPKKSI